jgi:hypothetical protein
MANLQKQPTMMSVLLDAAYVYDSEGRMASQSYPSWTGYDYVGHPTSTEPRQTLSYTYDTVGRLPTLADQAGSVISSTIYGPTGDLTASGAWNTTGSMGVKEE